MATDDHLILASKTLRSFVLQLMIVIQYAGTWEPGGLSALFCLDVIFFFLIVSLRMCPDLYAERNMPTWACREHCISKPFALNRRPEKVGFFLTVMTDLHARRTSFHTYWNCLAALYGVWLLGWGQWMTQAHCLTLLVNMKSRIPPAYLIFCLS